MKNDLISFEEFNSKIQENLEDLPVLLSKTSITLKSGTRPIGKIVSINFYNTTQYRLYSPFKPISKILASHE